MQVTDPQTPTLLARTQPTAAAPSRDVTLQGTWNTRQLGGLPTRGGVVKSGMVYRSDALQNLTPDDVAKLKGMPVRTVMDFREPNEVQKDGPDRYQAPTSKALPMDAPYQGSMGQWYIDMLMNSKDQISSFFDTLSRPESYPVLYHCHAGKDRTGIMSALLLMVLGTPRDQIMQDYLQSQHNQTKKEVDPTWMQGIFKAVDAEGTIDKFLQNRGVTPQQLYNVRRLLSESSAS